MTNSSKSNKEESILFNLIEGIKSQLSPIGKIAEFSVLDIKQVIPLSNDAIIIMEDENIEKIPEFIEIDKVTVVLEFDISSTVYKFCKASDQKVEICPTLEKKILGLNTSRVQPKEKTNKNLST
ncbi:hypothetical protein BB560_000089 [Smittium megazygosporum]|uniref:Uncharacterized protein n=1 Tax=Smittium megazygosporum TaxID=133381 RepID=A0A2T9ZLD8_9FUNG|nr:hypothetical protein BB560_000089 [Smittium megazygosporum]